ncbi:hypothetical protein [Roseateles chitosanitabidus]|uniref:hypothetical protein n=1 Tax=Roseateles chitosanitabidus TaxID=65048 RepID=UPI000833989F|nr:hypothetical protein [Roseateles chitosanitabidus]
MPLPSSLTRATRAPSSVLMSALMSVVGALALTTSMSLPTAARADGGAMPPAAKPAKAASAGDKAAAWRTLDPDTCTPLGAEDRARLPASWQPYLAFSRRCELTAPGGQPQVALISIFTLAYYEGKPDNAPWEKFPTPLLVDREFRCLGGLSQLFPWDQPAMLELKHGRWKEGVPQEIRVHVDNPAVSGPYDLPTLRWNAAQRRYQPVGKADAKEDPCPKS